MWNRSLILFPNPWMCNKQLTQCFALWITVKFKKHSCKFCYTHSMWVLTSWLQQNVHILCFLLHGTSLKLTVIQAVLHHTRTCAHSDTTPHTHRALSTVPEIPCPFCEAFSPSQGNRAMEDSQTCSSSDDNNHKTTRIRRKTSGTGFHQTLPIPSLWHPEALAPEREREAATAVVPEQRKQRGEAGFNGGGSQKTGCSMNSMTGGRVLVVMGASPFQGWVMHHFENDEMTGLWKPARHTVLLVTLQTDSAVEGGVGLRLGVGPLFVIWAA